MPTRDARLSLLTFPQSWDGTSLVVRFLCLPKGNPQKPLAAGLPEFQSANLVFNARLVAGFDHLPTTDASTEVGPLVLQNPPTNKTVLFEELTDHFDIDVDKPPVVVPASTPRFQKPLTDSYERLVGSGRRSRYLRDRDEYACALHEAAGAQGEEPAQLSAALPWSRLIAFVLRQPRLAEALGLMGQAKVAPPANFFENGGWLFLDLHTSSDYAGVDGLIARYGARIPPLATPRPIFAAVLFPVLTPADPLANTVADGAFREAEIYDDGIAKEVHGEPSADQGDSIQLAWDDEQVAVWLNRQGDRDLVTGELTVDRPTGVAGYRVDVRLAGKQAWHSLARVKSVGDLKLGLHSLGIFHGEGVVEAVATQHSPASAGLFWLPSYFATWRGASLVLADQNLVGLHQEATAPSPYLLDREKAFVPVADTDVKLRYGNTYEFRVRLVDLTRGGPDWNAALPEPPGSSVASIEFKRRRRPGPIAILERPGDVPPPANPHSITIAKPRLGYPDATFTGRATFADVRQDLIDSLALPESLRHEAGVFDPDVVSVTIRVQVKALAGDAAEYFTLYETSREMDADTLTIDLDFQDLPLWLAFAVNQPDDGPLALPTARELRLTFVAVGRSDAGYFFDESAREGVPAVIDVRAEATSEPALLLDAAPPSTVLQSFFFQPPPPDGSTPPPETRLAAEIALDQNGLTLAGKAGRRTVFGCSATLRHTLSPERSAVTFASNVDLVQRWVNVLHFTLTRDWTWDGLAEAGIEVRRTIQRPGLPDVEELAGTIRIPHALSAKSFAAVKPDVRDGVRQSTDVFFIDAVDPKPKTGEFPTELTFEYELRPSFKKAPAPSPLTRSVLVPITTPPVQVPRIVSAGIALSPYGHAGDYSSTDQRRRVLWFEFGEPPLDPGDEYFVRVLASAPDPLLFDSVRPLAEVIEPPLAIDPEPMRRITPGQPRDDNGLGAMGLIRESPRARRHYLVPLPDDLSETSPELFGFFVYEVRLGHTAARWSTAQGRFGPALRVAGVQHPAPPLVCQAARSTTHVLSRAPFATPVYRGGNLRPRVPRTSLWSLLYARVRQVDAAAWRNVLIAQKPMLPREEPHAADARELFGEGLFPLGEVRAALQRLGLPPDAPLTILAAEMFGDPPLEEPLGAGLGGGRILRIPRRSPRYRTRAQSSPLPSSYRIDVPVAALTRDAAIVLLATEIRDLKETDSHMRVLTGLVCALLLFTAGGVSAQPAFVNGLVIAGNKLDATLQPGANGGRFGHFSDIYYDPIRHEWWAMSDRGPGGGLIEYVTRLSRFDIDINPITGAISNFRIKETIKLRDLNDRLIGPTTPVPDLLGLNGLNPLLLNGDASVLGRSFDPEGLVVDPRTGRFIIADEYGPVVYEFGRTGRLVGVFQTPDNLLPKPAGTLDYVAGRSGSASGSGRQDNRGYEGIAISPDGKRLYAILQDPLINEGPRGNASDLTDNDGRDGRNLRIVVFDNDWWSPTYRWSVAQYVYQLEPQQNLINRIAAAGGGTVAPGRYPPGPQHRRLCHRGAQ